MVIVWLPRITLDLEGHRPDCINNCTHCCSSGNCTRYVILVWRIFFLHFFVSFPLLLVFSSSEQKTICKSNGCPVVLFLLFVLNGPPKKGSEHRMRFYAVLIWKSCEKWWSFGNWCAENKWDRRGKKKEQKGRKMEEDEKERKLPKLA